jgi:hypothetical protein
MFRPGLIILNGLILLGLSCGSRTGLPIPLCMDARTDGGPCCDASPEICNGLDDDCDGVADDGLTCFFLDGERLGAIEGNACGEAWYSYDSPDPESANPSPDIRISGGVVVAMQWNSECLGASIGIIADVPMDGSGGELNADFQISPPSAGSLLVGDEERECQYDSTSGLGTCAWRWQQCCTDGVLLGSFTTDACVTLTLSNPLNVTAPVVLDGAEIAIEKSYGTPMELCIEVQSAVP